MRWLIPFSLVFAVAVFLAASSPGADTKDESTGPIGVQTNVGPGHAPSVLDGAAHFSVFEGIPNRSWKLELGASHESFSAPSLALVALPKKYSDKGIIVDRSNPFLLRGELAAQWKAGRYRFLVQAKSGTRLYIDDELVSELPFMETNASGHETVPELAGSQEASIRPLPPGHQRFVLEVQLDRGDHFVRVDTVVGGKGLRAELGELCLAVSFEGEPFVVLANEGGQSFTLVDADWEAFAERSRQQVAAIERDRRSESSSAEVAYWRKRQKIARQEIRRRPPIVVPYVDDAAAVHNAVDQFIVAKLVAVDVAPGELVDDYAFLRRITLDTVGVVPTREEIRLFLADDPSRRRRRAIDRLLDDPRWADHWVGYWQDVLAENPGILKPKLNNTGPFRVWIYESFLDNKPFDRLVSELVMMQGSKYGGGPAGFGMATQNDVPLAAKAHVLTKAFMGLELKCARCHDAPYHPYGQGELFGVAAMLHREALTLPRTSSVALSPGARPPEVTVSLRPGDTIAPNWPFGRLAPNALPDGVLRDPNDPRERLAAILTSPRNNRFAQTVVNRLWHRYLGRGFVEPVDDWYDAQPSHPQLLNYLARELVVNGYDLKHVARLIFNSHTYQRRVGSPVEARLFVGPSRRRLTAEQIVDSLFVVSGKPLRAEALTLDPEGRRSASTFLNLGVPRRAWQFTSLSNERDRPALALPIAQSIIDTLVAFGWRDSRPQPITERDETATALQPLIVANGVMTRRIPQLSDDSAITALAMADVSLESFVEELFLQVLCRPPAAAESAWVRELLVDGYSQRRVENAATRLPAFRRTAVSWSNHLSPEATRIKLEMERAAQAGDPPTKRLEPDWRERCEDVVWALVNSPEFVFVP